MLIVAQVYKSPNTLRVAIRTCDVFRNIQHLHVAVLLLVVIFNQDRYNYCNNWFVG